MTDRIHRLRLPISLFLVLIVYLCGAFGFANLHSVWSPDCGARLIQIESTASHYPNFSIAYPGRVYDPFYANNPLSFFAYAHDGQLYVFYSFLFAIISAPLYSLFGFFGLHILSILGGWAAVLLTWHLAQKMGLHYPLVPTLLTAFCTPLALYSMVFWDHALLAAIGLAAVLGMVKATESGRPVWWLMAGLLLGIGVWFHEILLPFVPAGIVAAIVVRSRVRIVPSLLLFGAGFAVMLVPLLLINRAVYGTPLGPHLSNNHIGSGAGIIAFLGTPQEWILGAIYTLFGWGDADPAFTWQLRQWIDKPWAQFQQEILATLLMAVPYLLTGLLAVGRRWQSWWILSLMAMLWMVVGGIFVLTQPALAHGPVIACPFLIFGIIMPLRRTVSDGVESKSLDIRRLIAAIAIVYTAINLVKPTLGGTEWGSRHLLGVFPLFVLMGWAAIEPLWQARIDSRVSHSNIDPLSTDIRPSSIDIDPSSADIRQSSDKIRVSRNDIRPSRSDVRQSSGNLRPSGRINVNLLLISGYLVLTAVSCALTVHGFTIAYRMHERGSRLAQRLTAIRDDVIVTSVWWMTASGAEAYSTKKILYAGDADHPALPAFAQLRHAKVTTFTLVGYTTDDLSNFARMLGYVPLGGTDESLPMGLVSRRYLRIGDK